MNKQEKWATVDLYPVITPEFCKGRTSEYVLEEVLKAGVKAVQLRMKSQSDAEYLATALNFRKLTLDYGAMLIIDDRIDVALASKADGVHLGQEDFSLKYAVEIAPDLIYGISTHSYEEAVKAEKDGATYINVGPIFKTGTKQTPMPFLGTDILKEIIPHINIPFTVMGGIKRDNIEEVLEKGAKIVAMVTEITQADNIFETVSELRKIILSYR